MERKPAVAVVFHHIGPYHHARLNAAADRLSVTGIEWSAKGYDAWGAAATPARYHKVSLFPEATDHSPVTDGIEPDNRDSLKFLLLNETMNVRREPLAAYSLYAYEPVCSCWDCSQLASSTAKKPSLRSSADDV